MHKHTFLYKAAAYVQECGLKLNSVHGIGERVKKNLVKTHKINCKQLKLEKITDRQSRGK
jgi:hypothetical protein